MDPLLIRLARLAGERYPELRDIPGRRTRALAQILELYGLDKPVVIEDDTGVHYVRRGQELLERLRLRELLAGLETGKESAIGLGLSPGKKELSLEEIVKKLRL